jgi:hypothetical protein
MAAFAYSISEMDVEISLASEPIIFTFLVGAKELGDIKHSSTSSLFFTVDKL